MNASLFWEYACRAGTTTAFSFGDKITPKDANYADSKIDKPVAVGSYKPNAFGLYDMHGNLWEWCEDWHGEYPFAVTDPKGPAEEEAVCCGAARSSTMNCVLVLLSGATTLRPFGTPALGSVWRGQNNYCSAFLLLWY